MNKRFWISGLVLGIASLLLGFVIHAVLLQGDYATLPHLFRTEADAGKQFPFMLLAHLLIGFGMTWIYRRAVPDTNRHFALHGLLFGIGVAVLATVPRYLIYYAVQPMPGAVVVKQILLDTAGAALLGILVAWINRAGPHPS